MPNRPLRIRLRTPLAALAASLLGGCLLFSDDRNDPPPVDAPPAVDAGPAIDAPDPIDAPLPIDAMPIDAAPPIDGDPNAPPPTFDLLTPADGTTITNHGLIFFTAHLSGSNLQGLAVRVDGNGPAPGQLIVSSPQPIPCSTGCDVQIGWDAAIVGEGTHLITLTIADDVGRVAGDSVTLTFDDVPEVTFGAPSADLRGVGMATVRVTVVDRGSASVVLTTPAANFTGSAPDCRLGCNFSWVWNTTSLPAGQAALSVTATDAHAHTATATRSSLLGDLPIVTGIEVTGESDGIGFLEVEVHLIDAQTGVTLGCSGQSQDMELVDMSNIRYTPMAYFVTPSGARFEPANLAGHNVIVRVIEDDSAPCPGAITADDDLIGNSPPVAGPSLPSVAASFGRVTFLSFVIGRPLVR